MIGLLKLEKKSKPLNFTEFKVIEKFETGKLIVEGKNLYDSESSFIKERRKYSRCRYSYYCFNWKST